MVKVALCQSKVFLNKQQSVQNALSLIAEAASHGAVIVALPEMFNCPYGNEYFEEYSEREESSETLKALQDAAIGNKVHLICGSMPEKDNEKLYNTCYVLNPLGKIIGKFRKIHLFDVNIQGGAVFQESATITRGDDIVICTTEFGSIGICICYDLRFPELFVKMVASGAGLIMIPAAFSSKTGPKHWELLLRARAVDNQVYVAGISPSCDSEGGFVPYGHSMFVNPWGDPVCKAQDGQEVLYGEWDNKLTEKVREELPLLKNKRNDLYE